MKGLKLCRTSKSLVSQLISGIVEESLARESDLNASKCGYAYASTVRETINGKRRDHKSRPEARR